MRTIRFAVAFLLVAFALLLASACSDAGAKQPGTCVEVRIRREYGTQSSLSETQWANAIRRAANRRDWAVVRELEKARAEKRAEQLAEYQRNYAEALHADSLVSCVRR